VDGLQPGTLVLLPGAVTRHSIGIDPRSVRAAPGKPAVGRTGPAVSGVWKSKGNDMTELNDVVVLSGTRTAIGRYGAASRTSRRATCGDDGPRAVRRSRGSGGLRHAVFGK